MKIWVVGAKGMVGSALLEFCQSQGIEAVGTARQEVDICRIDQLEERVFEIAPSHIVNCAAFTDVDGAEKNEETAFAINREGASNVALVAKECGAHLIHVSTDYVFDGRAEEPYGEGSICSPANAYGKSKWEGEKRVAEILPSSCILRTSWVFGKQGKNFISSLFHLFQQKEELQVVFDQRGRSTYVKDLVEAILSLLNVEGIVHFANEGDRSRYQIALDLLDLMKQMEIPHKCERILPVPSSQFPTPAVRPSYSVLDTSKYFHLTGNKPRAWTEAVRSYLLERTNGKNAL